MKIFYLLAAVACIAISPSAHAQSKEKDAEKYRKASEEIRKQVWAWDKPQFKLRETPAQYANASKVVLARHTELTAESKSKFAFYVITFGVNKQQTITEVAREMIKLNDKTAVSDYSELSFTQFAKQSGFSSNDKTTSYVGVRIIKPNGSMKEINGDEIVLTKDEKREKTAKLAIPDLEPGDILDYFIATEQIVTNDFSTKEYRVFLFDDAPVMNLSFHGQLGKKYAVVYRSFNNAPELSVTKNEEKDIIIDVEEKDIPPFETSLWVSPGKQLPFIRMNISLGYKGMGSGFMGTEKPGEVTKVSGPEEALESKASSASMQYYNNYWMKAAKKEYDDLEDDAKKYAKQMGLNFKEMSEEEKATMLYYAVRFRVLKFSIDRLSTLINIGDVEYNGLSYVLFFTLKAAKLEPSIIVSTYKAGVKMNDIMESSDLTTTAYLPSINKYFSLTSVYDPAYTIPVDVEGTKGNKSFTFDHPGMIASYKKMSGLTNVADGPDIPVSTPDKNSHVENLKLSLAADKNNIAVQRSTTIKGYYKADLQKQLILYEDLYEAERKTFNMEMSLTEELKDSRKGKKVVDEVENAFAEARKKQKDAFTKEAKDWFEQDVTDIRDYKVTNMGIRHTSPDFVYSSSFNLAGLVKKAGNNLIVEIGKIQGQPFSVKPEQRKRDIDIYMPFARSLEYNIELQVPEGYTADGVAALNKKVENETGFFIVEANAAGNTITIKIKKHYLHNFEPAKNWDKLLQFVDAANEWVNAKLLLRKK